MIRPYWSGQIQISLVQFGVKLFVATEAKSEIRFHQISKKTGERVRYQRVNASAAEAQQAQQDAGEEAETAPIVEKDEILKGYEYRKGEYVTFEPRELDHLRVPSKHTMEVTQFVDEADIDPEYFEKPYFVVPENDSQAQAFAVVREALKKSKKIALTKIAFGGREHVVALSPTQDDALGGMMAYTMRYQQELRDAKEYFAGIKKQEVDEDSLALALELIKRKTAKFAPEKFVDGYEVALKELVEAKVAHAPIPQDEDEISPKRGNVVNLMDALRKSVAADTSGTKAPAVAAKRKGVESEKNAPAPKKGISLVKSSASHAAPAKTHAKKAPARRKSA